MGSSDDDVVGTSSATPGVTGGACSASPGVIAAVGAGVVMPGDGGRAVTGVTGGTVSVPGEGGCAVTGVTGGTVSVPGVYGGLLDKVPFGAAFAKGLTFRMGQTHVHRYLGPLLKRIEAGEVDPTFLITHRLRLDDAPAAYEMFNRKHDRCVKVVLRP